MHESNPLNLSQLLRQMADMIDAKQQGAEIVQEPEDYLSEPTGGDIERDSSEQPDDLFVPPLQLKMELLKKAVGVDNIYDDGAEDDEERHCYGELEAIKRNAGLVDPVVLDALDDDEPLEG